MLATTTLIPDRAAILSDLEMMTCRWSELHEKCYFELRAFAEGLPPQWEQFTPSRMVEAVEWAASQNEAGLNVYVVRNPVRLTHGGPATDEAIAAAFYCWADCDDARATDNVRKFEGPRWNAAVTTGRTPDTRVHLYWELERPVRDLAAWRDMQIAIADHLGSDRVVINPSRIMRVGGTVSYPNSKKQGRGYVPEMCTLRTAYDDERAPVAFERLARVFTPRQPAAGSLAIDTGPVALDRERARIQALSGSHWHDAVIRLVASYVSRGLADDEIHALTAPLTLAGYTTEQTRAEVQAAIDGARRKGWTPEAAYAEPDAVDFDAPAPPDAPTLEWYDDMEPALAGAYLIKGVLDAGTMSVVYGPSNSGKTFFALDMAFHVATGTPWQGRRVTPAAVLYLAAEGGRGVVNRIVALRQETGVCDVPIALRRAGLDLLKSTADLQQIAALAGQVQARAPGRPLLIVIDTLSRVIAGGDENSAADMTALIRNISAIAAHTQAHIMLVHHTGKDAARGARGHSSLRAATDTEIEVQSEDGARAAMVTKQRDHAGGETFAFGLKSVSLGYDQDGDEVVSCVVEWQDAADFVAQQKRTKGLGGNQKIIADTFDQMLSEGLGRPNPGGVGFPDPGRFWCVSLADLRRHAQGKMVGSDTGKLFRQAWMTLSGERGLFCMADERVWRTDRPVRREG